MTHYVTRAEIERFAEGRETSPEICRAILELAAGDADRAQEIWENGYEPECSQVIARAWELADPDMDTLVWGGAIERPDAAE